MLPFLSVLLVLSFLMISCGNKSGTAGISTPSADTSGLADFQSWRKQQEFASQYAIYQQNLNKNRSAGAVQSKKARSATRVLSNTSSYPAKAPEKKGWSKAAKGTVIGAASGAALGAVIAKKNRALGAVIGGVAGGGIGYGIGRHLDKKDDKR